MSVHIAIPEPTSDDPAYNQRSLPQYLSALQSADAIPVIVPLHERPDRVARLLLNTHGILLPGSGHDVDPEQYGETRAPECAEADRQRAAVDELLLQDAFNLRKPILGICFGAQTLNVWRGGSLIQHLTTGIDHAPGRTILEAHTVRVSPRSRLDRLGSFDQSHDVRVNSSHHQAICRLGDNLVVSALSEVDGVVEAIELDSEAHFVMGIQWHPERTYVHSSFSRAIFSAFVQAATVWEPRRVEASIS
jgi:putative glutamine amidotransferase